MVCYIFTNRFPDQYRQYQSQLQHLLEPDSDAELNASTIIDGSGGTYSKTEREDTKTLAGRFEIRQQIGKGGFAFVYRGWDTNLRRAVAIKVSRYGFEFISG